MHASGTPPLIHLTPPLPPTRQHAQTVGPTSMAEAPQTDCQIGPGNFPEAGAHSADDVLQLRQLQQQANAGDGGGLAPILTSQA